MQVMKMKALQKLCSFVYYLNITVRRSLWKELTFASSSMCRNFTLAWSHFSFFRVVEQNDRHYSKYW
jgi:hypothetical protein